MPGILTARFLTNSSVDVWLAARDEQKTFDSQRSEQGEVGMALVCLLRTLGTPMVAMRIRQQSENLVAFKLFLRLAALRLFRMDRSGCLRNTGHRQSPVFIVFLALCHSFTHIAFLIRCS